MLVMKKECKRVNASAEIYDDCCRADETRQILDRCAEISLAYILNAKAKCKDTAEV